MLSFPSELFFKVGICVPMPAILLAGVGAVKAHGVAAVRKSRGGAAIFARGQGDRGHRILPRSPRQSWATSRPRYPSHTPRDHCQECRRVVHVAAVSSPAAFRAGILPVSPRLHELDIATTTPTPSSAVLSESPPVHHWYGPRS